MQFNLVGVNHQTAPVSVREKLAINAEKLGDALASVRSFVPQAVVLSTCNRTEIYAISDDNNGGQAILDFLETRSSLPLGELSQYLYVARGRQAAEHLFRVASGLESMIVGEFEVLGQVKQALEAAEKAGMAGLPLRHVFHSAIGASRRVREETGISKNALSVSSVAVDLAAQVVGDLQQCRLVVIGAGEAGRLVAKVARERGVSQIVIANRTREKAKSLADELHGIPIGMESLTYEMDKANIIVACAAAPHRILEVYHVQEAMKDRAGLPLVIIDIAIPRNVEPEVNQIKDVYLYNLDGLTEISNANRKQREGEMISAAEIVTVELNKFMEWWHDFEIRPVVSALMGRAEKIRTAQLDKTLKKLHPLNDEERESLDAMTRSIVTKILKEPVQYLKENGNSSHSQIVKDLFKLDEEKIDEN
ncbi:MAG: glutamyl-tRNA reductase [Dehalococcoidales bacterium]|nr:glutamyl-tRNA reductase [Dehalococcoidales bacterium]